MEIFTLENLFTLFMLVLLQAVLGLDNLLYIALESKGAEVTQQKRVRRIGIYGAIILRITLLFILIEVISYFKIHCLKLTFHFSPGLLIYTV